MSKCIRQYILIGRIHSEIIIFNVLLIVRNLK